MQWLLLFLSILPFALAKCPGSYDIFRDGQCRGMQDKRSCSSSGNAYAGTYDCGYYCADANLGQVTIHKEEDNAYYASRDTNYGVWLAIFCNNVTNLWQWYDGSAIDYKPFKYDEELDQRCKKGGTFSIDRTGYWNYRESGTYTIYCIGQLPQPAIRMDGLNLNRNDGLLYKIVTSPETWQNAQSYCKNQGMQFASVQSQETDIFVRSIAIANNASNGLLLGASVDWISGKFTWSDGAKWGYENFASGFPVKGKGDCLVMDTFPHYAEGKWKNVDCSTKLPYVCAKPDPMISGPWTAGQEITSPGYPYDASTPAEYVFTVPSGTVQVDILDLQANSCCDYLIISDQEFGGNLLANLTGQLNPDYTYMPPFRSSSNFVKISWQPKSGKNVKGFKLSYKKY